MLVFIYIFKMNLVYELNNHNDVQLKYDTNITYQNVSKQCGEN